MKALEDYDVREVADYLRDWGYIVTDPSEPNEVKDGLWVSPEQLADIEHLLVCGQQEAAQNDLFKLLGKTLGRNLA